MSSQFDCDKAISELRRANSRGDLAAAVNVTERVLGENPDSAELWALCSEVMIARGRWDEARQAVNKAKASEPDSAVVCAAEALLDAYQAYFTEARAAAGKALALDDRDEWVLEKCIGVYVLLEEKETALALADRLRKLHPEDDYAVSLEIVLFLGIGRMSDAEKALEEAEKTLPDSPLLWSRRARFLARKGQMLESIDLLKRAADKLPGCQIIWAQLAQALATVKRLDEAESAARRALELSPIATEAITVMANICRMRGKDREAAEWESKAASAIPGLQVQMKLRKAVAAIRKDRWQECLNITDEVLSTPRYEKNISALTIKVRALIQLDRVSEAEPLIATLERLGGDRHDLCEFKAAVMEKKGQLREAADVLREGITDFQDSGVLRSSLIRVLHALDCKDEEKALVADTLQHLPQVPTGFLVLIMEFDKAGHSEAAKEIRQIGLRMFPGMEELLMFEAVQKFEEGDFRSALKLANGIKGDMRGVAGTIRCGVRFISALDRLVKLITGRDRNTKPPTIN